jgi:peptidyl-prolyl cis-trans isomerase B (cyclophilin B)
MADLATLVVTLFSILMPTKQWFAPGEALTVRLETDQTLTLVLTDFAGLRIDTDLPTIVEAGGQVDVRAMFPAMRVGTYVLYAVPNGQTTRDYVGTPLLIQCIGDGRPGAPTGIVAIRVDPLCAAVFDTTSGPMVAAFYYDVAPNTVRNFLDLARDGFFDGLTFHRVVPDFVIQSGDPLADSSGGPGYTIDAEFNSKQHLPGVLSMAREGDPLESEGLPPRPEFANTAGSQFFICLNYEKTRRLDGKYTAFGQLVSGLEAAQAIGRGNVSDAGTGKPVTPTTIRSVRVMPVRAGQDPYPINAAIEPTTKPMP